MSPLLPLGWFRWALLGVAKVALSVAIVVLSFGAVARADTTYVSGTIDTNAYWDSSGSPYVVTGDLVVARSTFEVDSVATLRIGAGVEVRFAAGGRLYVGTNSYSWGGRLVVEGTPGERVRFIPDGALVPGSWHGIWLNDDYIYGQVWDSLFYCDVEYSDHGFWLDNDPDVYMEGVRIAHCSQDGIYGDGRLYIYRSAIINNGGDGVQLTGGEIGTSSALGCDIYGNAGYNVFYGGGPALNAEYNYWGTTEISEILPKLEGNVDFQPYAEQPYFRVASVSIIGPDDGFSALQSEEVQILAYMSDNLGQSLSNGDLSECMAYLSSGEPAVTLFDDGMHGDYGVGDGYWGNTWVPSVIGNTDLTVSAYGNDVGGAASTISGNVGASVSTAELKAELDNFAQAYHDYLDAMGDLVVTTLAYQYELLYNPLFEGSKKSTVKALNAVTSATDDWTEIAQLIYEGDLGSADAPTSFAKFIAFGSGEALLHITKDEYLGYLNGGQIPGNEFKQTPFIIFDELPSDKVKSINEVVAGLNQNPSLELPDYVSADVHVPLIVDQLKTMKNGLLVLTPTTPTNPPLGVKPLSFAIPGSCDFGATVSIGRLNEHSLRIRQDLDENMALAPLTMEVSAFCGDGVSAAKDFATSVIRVGTKPRFREPAQKIIGGAIGAAMFGCNLFSLESTTISSLGTVYLTISFNTFIKNWPLVFAEHVRFNQKVIKQVLDVANGRQPLDCSAAILDDIATSAIPDFCIPLGYSNGTVTSYGQVTNLSDSKSAIATIVGYVYLAKNESGDPRDRMFVSGIESDSIVIPPNTSQQVPFTFEVPAHDWPFGHDVYRVDAKVLTTAGERYFSASPTVRVLDPLCGARQEFSNTVDVVIDRIQSGVDVVVDGVTAVQDAVSGIFSLKFPGSDVDLHVYDQSGAHVGRNYTTGAIETQIAGAKFYGDSTTNEIIELPLVPGEQYSVQVHGVSVVDSELFSVDFTQILGSVAEPLAWPAKWSTRPTGVDSVSLIGSLLDRTGQHTIAIQDISVAEFVDSAGDTLDLSEWSVETIAPDSGSTATLIDLQSSLADSSQIGEFFGSVSIQLMDTTIELPAKIEIIEPACCDGRTGNVDLTGVYPAEVDSADLGFLVNFLFSPPGAVEVPCVSEADVNAEGGSNPVDSSDLGQLVNYLFSQPPGSVVLPSCP